MSIIPLINPRRPPKGWFEKCKKFVPKSTDDPAALCGCVSRRLRDGAKPKTKKKIMKKYENSTGKIKSKMYQRGYEDAATEFSYIPDFASEKEKREYERGLKAGYKTRKKNPAKRRKTKTKGRQIMAGRKRTTRKRATSRRRTYRTGPRRRNVMSSRRRTYMPARSNPRKRRRTRRNATTGSRHRLTVYKRRGRFYAPRGPRAEELAMLKPETRINKRRRRSRRSNPRRGFIKTLTSRRMLMSGLKIGGGITGGFLAMPVVYSVLPVTFRTENRRWLGLGHVGIGALMVGMLRNKDAKDVGMIIAGTGIYDLIANNVPQLGLPPLPTAMPEMFGGWKDKELEGPESTSASYPVLSAPVSDVARRGIGASYEQSYSRAGSGLLGSNYEEPDEIEEMFADY